MVVIHCVIHPFFYFSKITEMSPKAGGSQGKKGYHESQQNEIKRLESILSQKQDELFQLQRNSCIPKMNQLKPKAGPSKPKAEHFIRPEKIILENSIATLKRKLKVMTMLSGMEVESYVEDDHCCIMYHMQHDSEHLIKHGVKINLKSGINEVSKVSFPLGFNFNAVKEDIDNIMDPKSHRAIKNALDAYYDRLNQYHALKRMLPPEVITCKSLDGSHMEITFAMEDTSSWPVKDRVHIQLAFILDYTVYDIRPNTWKFRDTSMKDLCDALMGQCGVFECKPLATAFQEVFVDGVGVYKMVDLISASQTERINRRLRKMFRNNQFYGETSQLSDFSDFSDDDVD